MLKRYRGDSEKVQVDFTNYAPFEPGAKVTFTLRKSEDSKKLIEKSQDTTEEKIIFFDLKPAETEGLCGILVFDVEYRKDDYVKTVVKDKIEFIKDVTHD